MSKSTRTSTPKTTPVLLRRPAVEAKVGFSRATLYSLMNAGDFPKPVKLGLRSVGWIESEVDAWIEGRIQARDTAA